VNGIENFFILKALLMSLLFKWFIISFAEPVLRAIFLNICNLSQLKKKSKTSDFLL
jgi:hypothetical protein